VPINQVLDLSFEGTSKAGPRRVGKGRAYGGGSALLWTYSEDGGGFIKQAVPASGATDSEGWTRARHDDSRCVKTASDFTVASSAPGSVFSSGVSAEQVGHGQIESSADASAETGLR
jgi:hypothetical protein